MTLVTPSEAKKRLKTHSHFGAIINSKIVQLPNSNNRVMVTHVYVQEFTTSKLNFSHIRPSASTINDVKKILIDEFSYYYENKVTPECKWTSMDTTQRDTFMNFNMKFNFNSKLLKQNMNKKYKDLPIEFKKALKTYVVR